MIDSVELMKSCEPFVDKSEPDAPVRGFLHRPDVHPVRSLVLTHGAGSNCNAPLLVALAQAFGQAGWIVLRCDLPFRQQRPHGPPPRGAGERDQAGLRAAIYALHRDTPVPICLGGHSYGGRQASMLAATDPALAEALLLLSYPLHPPQRPDVRRTAHLPDLRTPALFVHGTKDGFGTIAEMQAAIRQIPARTELLPIFDAGHDLITVKNRRDLSLLIANEFIKFAGD